MCYFSFQYSLIKNCNEKIYTRNIWRKIVVLIAVIIGCGDGLSSPLDILLCDQNLTMQAENQFPSPITQRNLFQLDSTLESGPSNGPKLQTTPAAIPYNRVVTL
jgi:hypothetical protein